MEVAKLPMLLGFCSHQLANPLAHVLKQLAAGTSSHRAPRGTLRLHAKGG